MRITRRRIWLGMVALAISLTLLTTVCQTSPKIEFVHEVPAIVFPTFPPPDCVTFDEANGLVSMPLWYWLMIAEYKIDIDALEVYLDRLRELSREKLGVLNGN